MKKKGLSLVLAALMLGGTLGTAGCKGAFGSSNDLQFWVYGDQEEIAVYTAMTDEFNATYGKEHGITVRISTKPANGYTSTIQTGTLSKSSAPDVFLTIDDYFKNWITMKMITNMDEYFDNVTDIDFSNCYETQLNRLRYDPETNTSNPDDDLWGLPLDSKPTALYYNESMFQKAGIVVISVDAEDMDEFNKGNFKDKRGMTLNDYKAKYPQLNKLEGAVPKKGYFRSMFPYTEGGSWTFPDADEVLIFNNRISMNWDEIEDLSMMFSPSYNVNAEKDFGTEFGFFTEWWFNYGWSVGGDCLQDLTGNGDWDYSLLDYSPNYIVMEGKTFTGAYTGKTYQAGETLEYLDKFDVPTGAKMTSDNKGGYTYNGEQVGVPAAVTSAVENGTLYELPSIRDAFVRYLKLGATKTADIEGEGGLNISPTPLTFSTRTRMNYFYSGEMAMLIDESSYMSIVSKMANEKGFEWDVAPLPIYKEYANTNYDTDPTAVYDDTTLIVGKEAGHSNMKSMFSCANSQHKQEAAVFMAWMASSAGQAVRAEKGHFPNQETLMEGMEFPGYAPRNATVFSEVLKYQGPGDWWYMPDHDWVLVWCTQLNSEVRNGRMSYDDWKAKAIPETNTKLLEYKKWKN